MAGDPGDVKEFPAVGHKLAAPKKLSAFEKERQAAEAKRLRAEEENEAALRAFKDSFDDDDDDFISSRAPAGPRKDLEYESQEAKYGMPPSGPRSGPGSMGSVPGPPPSMKRKRALDEMREAQEAKRELNLLSYETSRVDERHLPQSNAQDGEPEDDAAKPTVQLSNLPPEMTVRDIESLIGGYVQVHAVHLQPPTGPSSSGRRSTSAVAMLKHETTTAQIDTMVSSLKGRYMGFGFYLSISRHLSSAALHPSMASAGSAASAEPFGAEKPKEQHRSTLRNAPPPSERRGFAPPDSYGPPVRSAGGGSAQPEAIVNVRAPLDVETLRAIHVIVETLSCEPDPMYALEMEAFLMAKPDVQADERFAFLYDSRSPAGVYYRYLLWGPEQSDTVKEAKRRAKCLERVYDDTDVHWMPPYDEVPFPNLTSLAQVVKDIDYVSSDEESDDEGGERRFNDMREGDPAVKSTEKKHLSPVKRARLVHALARMPTNNARLRKGDVARVTNFVINHAGQGVEEIVDLLLLNVEKPFSYSLASKYEDSDAEQDDEEEDDYEPGDALPSLGVDDPLAQKPGKRDDDSSNAKLIALYLISDILSASSTAGARNAWKYRQLFETGFKQRKTFEQLGKLDKTLAWGRLKTEQWKRKIGVLFGIWESWSVFSNEVQDEFKRSFFEPPLSDAEKAAEQAALETEEKKKAEENFLGRFKKVGQTGSGNASMSPAPVVPASVAPDKHMEDVDAAAPHGKRVTDSQPITAPDRAITQTSGAVLDKERSDAFKGLQRTEAPKTMVESKPTQQSAPKLGFSMAAQASASIPKPSGPKRRMRAEDMFADSDED